MDESLWESVGIGTEFQGDSLGEADYNKLGKGKPKEEIEKGVISEKLNEYQRAEEIIKSGNIVQLMNLFDTVHVLAANPKFGEDVHCQLLPKMIKLLDNVSPELNEAAGSAFAKLIELNGEIYSPLLYPVIESKITGAAKGTFREKLHSAWVSSLLKSMNHLSIEKLKDEVLPLALKKGELSEKVLSRKACCRILGMLVQRLEKTFILEKVLGKFLSLCQDTDYEVRVTITYELKHLINAVDEDTIEKKIVPEIVELLKDEEQVVQIASFEAVVKSLGSFKSDSIEKEIFPFLKDTMRGVEEDAKEPFFKLVSFMFGSFFHTAYCKLDLKQEKQFFVDLYTQFSESTNSTYRLNAAYNLPAMTLSLKSTSFEAILPILKRLAATEDGRTRGVVAVSLHEVIKIMGSEYAVEHLRPIFLELLEDQDVVVSKGISKHLIECLRYLRAPPDAGQKYVQPEDLIEPILGCLHRVTPYWREASSLVLQLSELYSFFCGETVYTNFIPPLLSLMQKDNHRPVRDAAAKSMVQLIRKNENVEMRKEMCNNLISLFCKSESALNRSFFVDICFDLLIAFSRSFFKANFYHAALALSRDRIPNVKFKLCTLLPVMKKVIKLPNDKQLLVALDDVVRKLSADSDRDVKSMAIRASDLMRGMKLGLFTTPEENALDEAKVADELRITRLKENEKANAVAVKKMNKASSASSCKNLSKRGTDKSLSNPSLHSSKSSEGLKGSPKGRMSSDTSNKAKASASKGSLTKQSSFRNRGSTNKLVK
eukprot:Nk52_evm96s1073 gene=Nk52_evmTU96s1073